MSSCKAGKKINKACTKALFCSHFFSSEWNCETGRNLWIILLWLEIFVKLNAMTGDIWIYCNEFFCVCHFFRFKFCFPPFLTRRKQEKRMKTKNFCAVRKGPLWLRLVDRNKYWIGEGGGGGSIKNHNPPKWVHEGFISFSDILMSPLTLRSKFVVSLAGQLERSRVSRFAETVAKNLCGNFFETENRIRRYVFVVFTLSHTKRKVWARRTGRAWGHEKRR